MKKKNKILLADGVPEVVTSEDTETKINERLEEVFKFHIGEDNAIKPPELFYKVYNKTPEEVGFYRAAFWWDILKKVMRKMRQDGRVFIINNNGRSYYVLKTNSEARKYSQKCDRLINELTNAKARAYDYANKEKWRALLK